MSNIQELMSALILAPRPEQRQRFVALITPAIGPSKRIELLARSQGHARLRVMRAASREFKSFTFSVRPI